MHKGRLTRLQVSLYENLACRKNMVQNRKDLAHLTFTSLVLPEFCLWLKICWELLVVGHFGAKTGPCEVFESYISCILGASYGKIQLSDCSQEIRLLVHKFACTTASSQLMALATKEARTDLPPPISSRKQNILSDV